MGTIASYWIDKVTKLGGKYLTSSTVWDYYNQQGLGSSKNSNVYKAVQRCFVDNPKILKIWVKSGAKGRSQHSETDVLIFDVTNVKTDEIKYEGRFFDRV